MVGGIVALPLVQGLHIGAVRLPLQPRRLVVLFQLVAVMAVVHDVPGVPHRGLPALQGVRAGVALTVIVRPAHGIPDGVPCRVEGSGGGVHRRPATRPRLLGGDFCHLDTELAPCGYGGLRRPAQLVREPLRGGLHLAASGLGGLPGLVELIREPLVHGLRPATVTDDTHTPLGRELLIRPVRFIGGLVRLFRRPADVPVRKLILRKMEAARLISHCPPPAS